MSKQGIGTKELIKSKSTDKKGVYMLVNDGKCEVEDALKELTKTNAMRLRRLAEKYNNGDRLSNSSFKFLENVEGRGNFIAEFRIGRHRFLGFILADKFVLSLYYLKKSQKTPKKIINTVLKKAKSYCESI